MGIELMTSSLPRMRSTPELHRLILCFGAENEVRTRDPQLGRLMLYQLSYFRKFLRNLRVSGLHLGKENKFFFSLGLHRNSACRRAAYTQGLRRGGRWWTRTTEP